jgi:hypothetical protein
VSEPTEGVHATTASGFTFNEAVITPLGGGEPVSVGAGWMGVDYGLEEAQSTIDGIETYVRGAWDRVVVQFEAIMTPEFVAWLEWVIATHDMSQDGIDCWEGEGGSWR